jgi:hypothetical protein
MSEAYLRAIQEVQQWLRDAALEHNIYVLLDSAYDDLDAISKVTDAELDDMVAIFKTDYNRSAMREHVLKLRSKGIAAYRAQVAEQQRQIDALLADTHDADGWAASASASSSSSSPSSSSAAAVVAAPAVSSAASASASDPPAAQGPAPSPPSQADAAAAAASRPQAAASASARASVVVSPAEGVAPALADAARRPQPPHEMSGFLSLRCASVFGSEWVDRFCVFRDERLSWFKSRRDVEAEGSLHVSAVTGARKVDEQTWVLSQEGCEFEVSCDEAGGLAPWVPVLSYFADVARYVEQRGKSFSVSSLPSQRSQIESKRSRTDADVLSRLESGYTPKQERLYKQLLQQGGEFKKYKYNSATKRLIWVTEEMDKLVWGDRDRTEVRGFLRVSLIRTVESGRGKDRLKIFIHTQPRTLELEARDEYEHSDWLAAFSFLIKFHVRERERDRARAPFLRSHTAGCALTGRPSRCRKRRAMR